MLGPVNTLAQFWLWRLELRVASVLFVVAVFALVAVLGAFRIDPVWAFVIGFGALIAPALYYLGRAFMDWVDQGAGETERSQKRMEKAIKGGPIDYSPGWQQRLLERDIARWKAEGNVKQLREFGVEGY